MLKEDFALLKQNINHSLGLIGIQLEEYNNSLSKDAKKELKRNVERNETIVKATKEINNTLDNIYNKMDQLERLLIYIHSNTHSFESGSNTCTLGNQCPFNQYIPGKINY